MKKVIILIACMFAAAPLSAAKAWVTKLENNSPFYVTFQNSDPTAKSIVNKNFWLKQDAHIVGPKSSITLEDSVIPWQTSGGIIKISVNGVELSGNPFTVTQTTLQEVAGDIWLDTGTRRDKITRAENFMIMVNKDGTVTLK